MTDSAAHDEPGVVAVLSGLVRRIVAPNPSPMTYKGTCTYLVGRSDITVIDPGPAIPEHIDRILAALGAERIGRILVTHTHRDHSPGARLLRDRTGASVFGCAPYHPAREPVGPENEAVSASNDLDFEPERILADGEVCTGADHTLTTVATPGHTMNHLAFALKEEKALFSGDHVMAWSTTIVAPPTGSMSAYMTSLEKLRQRDDKIYWPGHGGPVTEPQRYLRALQTHRRQRESAILARLDRGAQTAGDIAASVYETLEPALLRAATSSVLAHLEDLLSRGLVERLGPPGRDARFRRTA